MLDQVFYGDAMGINWYMPDYPYQTIVRPPRPPPFRKDIPPAFRGGLATKCWKFQASSGNEETIQVHCARAWRKKTPRQIQGHLVPV